MADNSQREKIEQFTNLTGIDADRAKFYLESSGWNIELAVASFYEHGDDDDVQIVEETIANEDIAQQPPPQRTGATKSSRFGTISALTQSDSDNSDSDEQGQAFYAGGSEHSGQQVLGPPKKKETGKKIVDSLFKSAKEHGAEEIGGEGSQSQAPGGSRFAFRGAGYKLGETEDDPVSMVQGKPMETEKRQVDMVLKLWKNGFSIDDGPLRDFHDPANKEFLDAVSRGEVPRELISRGKEVNLNMEDHRTEDYVQPKVSLKPFTGAGHMLGSPAPSVVKSPGNTSSSSGSSEETAKQRVKVDDKSPTTNLQVRLADGSRLVIKLNHTHRISDIRNYITIARPEYASSNFVLLTTFPNKELSDESQNLADAKLLNAVIVQRLK
ncbi:NSFL1 cofactor p47-like isoform X1 [Ostrea edulis]|uniref:NSFL1 cofactor p47-like isoform X1 n=1 Tax=Ostrea edulis TaxID=37623 RepID=UPI0024AE979F|nr:NSFL1 cofactor p47-like isoform X1 [Ostrea edulis]